MLRIGIAGCGNIGQKRAIAAKKCGDSVLIVSDIDQERAAKLGDSIGAHWCLKWQEMLSWDLDAIVVSTTNNSLCTITTACLEAGLHVLCEKPMGRDLGEAIGMAQSAERSGKVLKIGFNHRFHPAISQAHQLVADGKIGPLLFIRARYGHGARPGVEKEWRSNPDIAGGGEILDQGIHILDLVRWFGGDFPFVFAKAGTLFWPIAPTEDNGMILLWKTEGTMASIHVSITQWKNLFSFEVFGADGYVRVEGLGGSYGMETLIVGKRKPESGPPDEKTTVFPESDPSWFNEWLNFKESIRTGSEPNGSANDGVAAMRTVSAVYESVKRSEIVNMTNET